MVSVVDNIQRFCMVSVVCVFYGFRRGRKRLLWFPSLVVYGFRRGKKTCLMVSVAGFLVDSAAAGGSRNLEGI